jgi:hypothetical protein
LLGDWGHLGNRADRRSGRRTGGPSNLAYCGRLPLPDDVSPHPLLFRPRGGAGDGASARDRGTTINPRYGGRGQIGGRGALGDLRRLRGRHQSFRGGGIGRRRSGSGNRAAEAARNQWGGALKFPFRQCLARVGGRARFALSTPRCAGRGREDGGAPKFFVGRGQMGGLFRALFWPQPANRRLFCGWGDFGDLLELL